MKGISSHLKNSRIADLFGKSMFFGVFLLSISNSIFAQSGRIKPKEAPTPERPKVVYTPAEVVDPPLAKATPAPIAVVPQGDDVIKVESALVPIPVSVTDVAGKAVANLKIEDFELQIDGKPQEIAEIVRSTSPVRLALLFDNSSSVSHAREFEKVAAIRFFKQVIRPEIDQAALFSVATHTRLEQPLTKNIAQLVAAIEGFAKPEGATALLDGIIQAANYLQDYRGRRVIVIVSDGEDTLSDSSLEMVVKAIQTANCQVYVVKTTEFENLKITGRRTSSSTTRSLTAERRMQELAQQTGGAVYSPVDENELNKAFSRISAELSEQYILSYYPENTGERGKFREISLQVKNRPNVTVRARKGYYVPKLPGRQ